MYGTDGRGGVIGEGGIRDRLQNFISKKALWSILGSILIIIVMAFITINNMWAETKDLPEQKAQIKINTETNIKQTAKLESLEKDISEIKASNDKIVDLLTVLVDEADNKRGVPERQ